MKLKSFFSTILLCIIVFSFAQLRINLIAIPKDTPENASVFVAGSFNNWIPNDPNFQFKKNLQHYTIEIPETTSKSAEFKFTLGSWDKVEVDSKGNPINNRILNFNDQKIVEMKVEGWQNQKERKSTASKNVHVLNENFNIPQLNTTRKIWIYLPEDYVTTKKKYPVIYMHDGQNLFDEVTAYAGEWKVDETLDALFKKSRKSFIVVGIDHGAEERLNDYGPWNNPKYGGGNGDLYGDFLAKTLKPYIDNNYRTLSSAKNTGLIGSSMGGLISLYTGVKYPSKFGKLGVFSPSTWFTKTALFEYLNKNIKGNNKSKFYLYGGHLEGDHLIEDLDEISELIQQKGINKSNIKISTEKEGTHKEVFWAKEFPKAIEWLFLK